jgi:hypothetical protein
VVTSNAFYVVEDVVVVLLPELLIEVLLLVVVAVFPVVTLDEPDVEKWVAVLGVAPE